MLQRLTAQFPAWMRPGHPLLRYAIGAYRADQSSRGRYLRAFLMIIFLGMFVFGGYVIASNLFRDNPLEQPLSQMFFNVLFWPAFILQIILQIAVLILTINTISEEKRRQTWESLKTTASGAALMLRTRWSAVLFYRLRTFVMILIIVRLILIGGILFDLTAFRGEYLNYLTGSITPEVPLALGVVLLSFTMTASVLLPFTGLGFDAAFGLLVSTVVQQRTYVVLTQITLVAIRVAIIGALLFGMTQFRADVLQTSDLVTWGILLAFGAMGDWGLSFLYLGFYGAEIWAEVPYGIFMGLGLLVFVVIQAALTDGIMALAIRRAEHSE